MNFPFIHPEYDIFNFRISNTLYSHILCLSTGSFPIEKATKLGNLAFRGRGSSKNQKSPKFQRVSKTKK